MSRVRPYRIEAATETVRPLFAFSTLPPSCAELPGRPGANPFTGDPSRKALASQNSNASAAILWCLSDLTKPRRVPVLSIACFAMAALAPGVRTPEHGMGQSQPLPIQEAIGGAVQYLHLRVPILLNPHSASASKGWNSESVRLPCALLRAFGWTRAQVGTRSERRPV